MDQERDWNVERDWGEFEHKMIEGPKAEAYIDDEGEIVVTVYLTAKHWIILDDKKSKEDIENFVEKNVKPCKSGLGFKIPLEKFWLISEGCETPVIFCGGKHCVGTDKKRRREDREPDGKSSRNSS